ncbi:TNT domain-containing protein [Mycobacterium shigaense]|uniref:TNT domain-containing protein n=1 Tax=Mycobacterium shigaense TaxID=722731 RepID=UPI0014760AA5
MTDADITSLDGKWLDRIGAERGKWLALEGIPYEGRALPHTSLNELYYSYKSNAAAGLPPGWKMEYSLAAPWFGHPGGGPQFLILASDGQRASIEQLLIRKFLLRP